MDVGFTEKPNKYKGFRLAVVNKANCELANASKVAFLKNPALEGGVFAAIKRNMAASL